MLLVCCFFCYFFFFFKQNTAYEWRISDWSSDVCSSDLGLRQRRGPQAKISLHNAHLAPDAWLQAPGASLAFAECSHGFELLDRGIGRGDRFETAHRLVQYLELSVIGLDHVIEILHLPVGRLPVQLSFALQFGDRCTIARRFVGIERGRLFPVLQASQGLAQEPLRCLGAAGRRQVEIERVSPLFDCRSEERRVGKGCVSTCSSRGAPYK